MTSAMSSDGGRRGIRRLQHHGVAGGQSRGPLPDGHHQRVVPRRHRRAHPDRLAPDHRGVVLHVLACRFSLEVAGGSGEEADLVDQRRDLLGHGDGNRLAGVVASRPGPGPRPGPRARRRSGRGPGCARTGWRPATAGRPRPRRPWPGQCPWPPRPGPRDIPRRCWGRSARPWCRRSSRPTGSRRRSWTAAAVRRSLLRSLSLSVPPRVAERLVTGRTPIPSTNCDGHSD